MKSDFYNCYQPLRSFEEWRKLLIDPELHWKDGKSAKELVKYWADRNSMPLEFTRLFGDERVEIVFMFPEYQVSMPASGRNSSNDLYILAVTETGYSVIMIESKAGESFDELVSDWYKEKQSNSDQGKNASNRLNAILCELGLKKYANEPYIEIGRYRYQLFHRTLSAIREAKRIGARKAVVIVQSFAQDPNSLNDFIDFVSLFIPNPSRQVNNLIGPVKIDDIELSFAWLECECREGV